MPCNTIQTVQVQWNAKKTSSPLLESALRELTGTAWTSAGAVYGNGVTYDCGTGTMTIRNAAVTEQQLKRAYSAQVVKSQARRFGWALKETAPYQYQITKR